MRILVICNPHEKNNISNVLVKHNVAVGENIIFVSNFEQARDFIINHLVTSHQHIDLIITADKLINNDFDLHLVDWIRYRSMDYSEKNFKVSALPVILYDKEIRSSDYYQYGFDAMVEKNSNDNHRHFLSVIQSVVKNFRSKILDDLDLLKIELEDLQANPFVNLDLYYLLKIKTDPRHWASRTKILSQDFIKNPRRLRYDWLENNKTQMEQDIDRYQDILKNLLRYNRVDSEKKVLHRLYNEAQWILQQDLYKKPIYEPALMKNESQYEEPDYLLPSAFPGIIPTNITEVKPHLFRVLHERDRKPGFRQQYDDSLTQISDYERLARTRKGRKQIDELVDYETTKLSFTLLASNGREMEKNQKRVEELRRDHYPKVKLESHDDKLQQAIAFYERLENCRIA
ncbi:MAG: hypothetical protein WDO16_10925 [Bacteroidota bacterium]